MRLLVIALLFLSLSVPVLSIGSSTSTRISISGGGGIQGNNACTFFTLNPNSTSSVKWDPYQPLSGTVVTFWTDARDIETGDTSLTVSAFYQINKTGSENNVTLGYIAGNRTWNTALNYTSETNVSIYMTCFDGTDVTRTPANGTEFVRWPQPVGNVTSNPGGGGGGGPPLIETPEIQVEKELKEEDALTKFLGDPNVIRLIVLSAFLTTLVVQLIVAYYRRGLMSAVLRRHRRREKQE